MCIFDSNGTSMGYSLIGGGGGVLLAIPGGGAPHGSPNPDTISDQKMSFFPPIFRPVV